MKKVYLAKVLGMMTLVGVSQTTLSALPTDAQKEKIKQQFAEKLPKVSVDTITQSPIEGVYQVNSGPLVLYVTKDARYAISGDILDLEGGQMNVTEEARKMARVKALDAMKNNMIVFSPEKPKYSISVFTDLDCGYCQKLHEDIKELNDLGIEVKYLAFPRAGIDSDSYKKAISVWCAKDRKAAFTAAGEGKSVDSEFCMDHKVDEQYYLALKTGISGTPALVLADGSIVPGYLPPDRLLQVLEQSKQ